METARPPSPGRRRVSARAARIPAFEVMDVLAAARVRDEAVAASPPDHGTDRGRADQPPTCHLEVGQPSAATPRVVLDAAAQALEGPLGYTDAAGLPALRERIATHYGASGPEPARVVVTSGASAGCVLALAAVGDPGDSVVVFEPGYPCYANIAEVLGLRTIGVHLDSSTGYRPNVELLDRAVASSPTARVAAVVVASPSNPTGTVLDDRDLAALAGWCAQRGATLVVDEIYHGTACDTLASAVGIEDAVVVQSFSKYFCMTGWRLGWLVLPEHLVRPVERLSQNLYLAPHTLSQHAALAAFDATEELDALAAIYATNRERLIGALRYAGVTGIAPAVGAFYVWADLGRWGDSRRLTQRWLDEIGVAATPGQDFDPQAGDRFVRFSVAGSPSTVQDASERLAAWLEANPPERPR